MPIAQAGEPVIDPDDRPAPRSGVFVLALLMALYTLSYIDRSIISLLLQPMKEDLKLSDLQVSLLVGAAFSLFYATMGIPLGYVADRWNRGKLITIGVTMWTLMTALGGAASNYAMLFITRAGVGLGEAALAPAAYSMLADIFPKRLMGRVMALFALSSSLGSGLAIALGGAVVALVATAPVVDLPLIGSIRSWRAVLIVIGLAGLILAAAMLFVREPARKGVILAEADRVSAFKFVWERRAILLPLYFGLGFVAVGYYGMVMWAPTMFLRKFGVQPKDISFALGCVVGLSGMAGMIIGGFWADRLWQRGVTDGYMRVIAISAGSSAIFFVLAPLMPTIPLTLAVLSIGCVCQGMQSGLPAGAIQQITPNDLRARVTAGCFLAVGLIGLGMGPTAVAIGSEYIFGEANVGQAIALSSAIFIPLAASLLMLGLKPFRQAVARMEAAATRG